MRKTLLKSLLNLYLLCSSFLSFSQTDVVCRAERIAGYDAEYTTGKSVCGPNTYGISEAKIYLTVKDGDLYVHSNFITPGAEYPTKLASTGETTIENIVMNLIYAGPPSDFQYASMRSTLRSNIEVILDPALLNSSKHGNMDFSGVRRLKIVCPDNEVREAITLRHSNGMNELCVKYNDQISIKVKGQDLEYVFSSLRSQKVNFKDLKIISLIDNRATANNLTSNFTDKTIGFDFSTVENFKSLLLQNQKNRILILGHIEDGHFVTIGRDGTERFRISLVELEDFQKANKLELILLGCNSATEGATSGAANKFNSIDALNRLKTTQNTETTGEFLDSLSFRTLHFVLGSSFFSRGGNVRPYYDDIVTLDKGEVIVYRKQRNASFIDDESAVGQIIFLGIGLRSDLGGNIVNVVYPDTAAAAPIDPGSNSTVTEDTSNQEQGYPKPTPIAVYILIACVIAFMSFLFLNTKLKK
jgi:hypothetical protein